MGAEQSGHLMNVGYELYLKLLEEAVLEEKGEKAKANTDCAIKLAVSAGLPDSYVPDAGQRIDLYRRIAAVRSERDREDVLDELIDRFGEPPATAVTLCDIALLRAKACAQGIVDIRQENGRLRIMWAEDCIDLRRISELCNAKPFLGRIMLNAGKEPYVHLRLKPKEKALQLSQQLVDIYLQTEEKQEG